VKKQLFGRLHDIARQQLFPTVDMPNGNGASSSTSGAAAVPVQPAALPPPRDSFALPSKAEAQEATYAAGRTIDV
jgi:arogenate dehydrogenase (NADP+)